MAQPSALQPAIEEELDRILASREFQNSGRMCRFLRFIVTTALAGKGEELKEYSIALAVFDRESDFDQRTDPVVRNEARRLRKKLDNYYATDGANDPVVIELPKGGYVPLFCERPVNVPVELSTAQDAVPRRKYWYAIAVAVLALSIAGFFLLHTRFDGAISEPIRSIAVLPFQNMTGDKQMDYLADGIADEVLNSLAHLPDLKVVARTSAAQFKGRNADAHEIGQRLGVKTLLEGSVRSSAGKLRVMPRLVNAQTGYQIWSQNYEFQTNNLFQVQDNIAHAVAQQLGQQMKIPARRVNEGSAEAYKSYILGRHYLLDAEDRASSYHKAIKLLEQTVALDPDNGDAWASLASAYGMSTQLGFLPTAEGLQKATQYGQKALEINPNSANALANKGAELAILHHDWIVAERLFRRALENKPSDSLNHYMYAGCVLWPMRRVEEARKEQEKAIELDPLSTESRVALANTLYFQHHYSDSIRAGQEALALDPGAQHVADNLLRPLVITGRVDDISALMQRFWKDEPGRSFVLSMKSFAAGNRTAARRYAQIALKNDKDLSERANLYAVLDDEASVIRTFETASPMELNWAIDGAVLDPAFDRYRSSPQFQHLIQKLLDAR